MFIAAAVAALIVTGCNKDGAEITNTLKMLGETFTGVVTMYQGDESMEVINFDQNPGTSQDGNFHGFCAFATAGIGKTVDIAKEEATIHVAYNFSHPIGGFERYYPELNSGTIKIEKVEGGYWLYVDAKDSDGRSFFMDVLAVPEFVD